MAELKLSEEKLRDFHRISRLMIPRCFGGFDKDDEICKSSCARATPKHIADLRVEIRKALKINTYCDMFIDEERGSCQYLRAHLMINKLEDEMKKADFYRSAMKNLFLRKIQ